MIGSGSALGAAAGVLLVGAAVGRRLLGPGDRLPPPLRLAASIAVGLAIVMVACWALAAGRALTTSWLVAVAVVLLLAGAGSWTALVRDCREGATRLRPQSAGELAAASAVVLIFALGLGAALAPPRDPDGLAYHLPFAAQFAAAGALEHVSALESYTAAYPLGGEVLFAAAMVLGGDTAPAVVQFGCGLVLALLVLGTAEWVTVGHPRQRTATWLTTAVVATSPIYVGLLGSAYVDLLFVLIGLTVVTLARQERFVIAGLMAGVCAGLKPGFGLLPGLFGLWIAARRRGGSEVGFGGRAGWVRFVLAAGSIGSMWPAWRWWTTGNPIYPWIWGGRDIPAEALPRLLGLMATARYDIVAVASGRIPGVDLIDLALSHGPLALALVPLGLIHAIRRRQDPESWICAAAAAVAVGALYARGRFLLLALGLLVPDLARLCALIEERPSILRSLVRLCAAVALVWASIFALKAEATHLRYVLGGESRREYNERWFGDYPLAQEIATVVPASGRVLDLCKLDCGRYHLRYPRLSMLTFVLLHGPLPELTEPPERLLRADGVTHILDCGGLDALFTARPPAEAVAFRRRLRHQVGRGDKVLYEIAR